jgi:mannose-1-phosphate guanylyltransferase
MKALILAGGKATRLEPLTINTPKALIPVLNVPFLEYVIRNLAGHNIEEIVLAMGHLSQPIEDYLGDGSKFGVRLNYSIEDSPLGSAGAAKNAEMYLDGTFLVLNGDIFSDMDFTAMIELHRKKKAKATIAVTPVDDPTRYGLVDTDEGGRVTRFLEKPKPEEITTNMINAGAWLVEPDVLSRIPPQTQFSFERNVFPQLLDQGEPVYAYVISGYWIDMGTPETYLQLHRDLLGGKSKHYTPAEGLLAGEDTDIHPEAEVTGPVLIGDNCSIGRSVRLIGPVVIGNGCTIGEDCIIQGSVIWRNVSLGRGVGLRNCVVAESCRFDAGSSAEDVVLGDNVTVVSDYTLKPGSKIWPEETV